MSRRALATSIVLVALGGSLGGVARHALDVLWPVGSFPWGTLAINLVGSALLATLPAVGFVQRHHLVPAFLGSGVLGGFTTLSAFSEQTRVLLDRGHDGLAASYVVASVGAGLVAVLVLRRVSTPSERAQFEADEGDE
ncbi:MAG: CrcB family protein [Marmoricola sp.]